jgi:adenine-specific DNA-methyltransferase
VAASDVNESARAALEQSKQNVNTVQKSERLEKDDYFFLSGEQLIFYKSKTRLIDGVLQTASPLTNLWDDLLSNNLHNEGGVSFPNGKKPEALIKRCLELSTNPGDLVLDSFGGSGTTGAVAHKMGRRWIMVELGEHCHTHIVPRLQKVIDGQDPGGVTQATNWQGGGGFRYYELAPTLLATDRWGNLVINPEYDAAMLAAAMCKLEGFSYAPSEVLWWQQGYSSERDFIYVTTQTLSSEQLASLNDEVGADPNNPRSLLVCCGAYRGVTAAQAAERWPNLTIKKIPKMVKDRCEWGHDDYSLNVANLPMAQKKVAAPPPQDDLFTKEGV